MNDPKTGSESLAALIRARREAKGMSRRDLAAEAGLSYPYISQLETAYRLPSSRAMQALARALDIAARDLFDALPDDASLPVSSPPKPARAYDARSAPPDEGRWITNPARRKDVDAGIAEVSASPVDRGRADATHRAIRALESLGPQERLAALQEVQAAVVAGIVRDRSAGG